MKHIQDKKLKKILLDLDTENINESSFNSYNELSDNSFIDYLLKNNIASYKLISNILHDHFFINSYKLDIENISAEAIDSFDIKTVGRYSFLPFSIEKDKIQIATSNPFDHQMHDNLRLLSGKEIEVFFSKPKDIKSFINHFYNLNEIDSLVQEFKNNNVSGDVDNSPVVKILDILINDAVLVNASDIHIEPAETTLRVRFRIDGALKHQRNIDKQISQNIVSRLKIMSGMEISTTRKPQDGHFKHDNIENIDFRVSTLPVIFGEKVVIRLIYSQGLIFDLEKNNLEFFEDDIETIKLLLRNSTGIVLVTGATGSGKTTTLSSFVSYLKHESVNIITLEDPVENIIDGVNQVTIDKKSDLYFDKILENLLRQDPDIIMVGEIRDSETAKTAMRSALTGHLVLATLHTNDALSSVIRLIDLGVKSYLVTSIVRGIISQCLVRKLCSHCKEKVVIPDHMAQYLNIEQGTYIYEKRGCKSCFKTGYKGRLAIYEILVMNNKVKILMDQKMSFERIKEILVEDGMVTIRDNAIKQLLKGNTSLEEILKVTM